MSTNADSKFSLDETKSQTSSIDTNATERELTEQTKESKKPKGRRRGQTITLNSRPADDDDTHDTDDTEEEEEEEDDEDDDKRDEEQEEDDFKEAPESHRSTVSSLHSFVSSASNYDLLLAQFWSKVVSDYNGFAKSNQKAIIQHIQRGGIPPTLRGMVWQLLVKSKDSGLEEKYLELLKNESVYEKAIWRDIPRTFADQDYFSRKEGQDALFNVAKAYSLYDTQVGYCHGIAFVAGPLLLNMPEEEAFCVLVKLMQRDALREHYTPQGTLLSQRLYQLQGLVGDHLPHIQRHFEAHNVDPAAYASNWFLSLFAYKFPLDLVYRIYDLLLADGIEILFKVVLALLEKNQATLLSLESDRITHFLRNDILSAYRSSTNQLIRDAHQIQLAPKRLLALAKQFQANAAKANTELEAMTALKRQNKALGETVKRLETKLAELNKEHDKVAQELIQSKMEVARIHDENDALRQQSFDLKRALELLPNEVETRVREEMEVLSTKNAALVQRNVALEDQLGYMENLVIEMKVKYAESENERETLQRRLSDLKKLVG
ncbi:rab-GTPase-TBC domain-domain-containing protein [Syncephalastrum racemosum]|uniref:Rab-GTPase-TBC domain-domain-containing protein n=1 Tax=Syncephalastrum racemosum TaxID=13706 RepID=A0A1X2H9N7_SYNRA|nr:rab-GTPase-TBC domain-domain-containing protein [Syncephalastrum racemosum]